MSTSYLLMIIYTMNMSQFGSDTRTSITSVEFKSKKACMDSRLGFDKKHYITHCVPIRRKIGFEGW